eukprot:Nk52_evm42s153 gene=Nk52_evmTU42s153
MCSFSQNTTDIPRDNISTTKCAKSCATSSSREDMPLLSPLTPSTWSSFTPLMALGVFVVGEKASSTALSAVMLVYFMEMFEWSAKQSAVAIQILHFSWYILAPICGYFSDMPAPFGRIRSAVAGFTIYGLGFFFFTCSSLPCTWKDFPNTPGVFSNFFLFLALVCNAIGSGVDKSVVPSLIADQALTIGQDTPRTVERIFRWQSFCSNLGPVLLGGVVPYLHNYGTEKKYGGALVGTSYYLCFAACTGVYFIGWLAFIMQIHRYVDTTIDQHEKSPIALDMITATVRNGYRNYKRERGTVLGVKRDPSAVSFLAYCDGAYRETATALSSFCKILPFSLGIFGCFMALYSQYSATIVIQATFMKRPSWFLPEHVAPAGCLIAVILIPIQDWLMNYLRGPPFHVNLGPHRRIQQGFMSVIAGFLYLVGLQYHIQQTGSFTHGVFTSPVSVWWQIPFTVALSWAVLLCGSSAMEYSYQVVPDCGKGVALALYFLSVAMGSLISIFLSPLMREDNLASGYTALTLIMILATIVHRYFYKDTPSTNLAGGYVDIIGHNKKPSHPSMYFNSVPQEDNSVFEQRLSSVTRSS